MKPILVAICATIFFFQSLAQGCFPEGLTLMTNQEVADFASNNPGCTIIEGDLIIGDDVTSLVGLSMITEVVGNIYFNVESSPITSLEGLNSLTSVGGFNLPWSLSDLDALSSLTQIGGIYIYDQQMAIPGFEAYTNQFITCGGIIFQNSSFAPDFTGFGNLEHTTSIEINEGAEHIYGFDNLQSIGTIDILSSTLQVLPDFNNLNSLGDFNYIPLGIGQLMHLPSLGNTTSAQNITIQYSNVLTDLSGFESLQSVNSLILQSNYAMTSLSGLDNLQTAQNLQLFDMQSLISIENLSGLISLFSLQLDIVPQLSTLAGLDQLSELNTLYLTSNYALVDISSINILNGLSVVTIGDNPLLEACSQPWLCDYVSSHPGEVSLSFNGNGCNLQEEILLGCGNQLSSLTGMIYYDRDCDAALNGSDFVIPNAIIFNSSGYPLAAANSSGYVEVPLLLNTTTTLNTGWMEGTETTYFSIETDGTPTVFTQDIGVCPTPIVHDLRVLITPADTPRPGFSSEYFIHAINLGNTAENVVLTFDNFDMPGFNIYNPEDINGEVTWTFSLEPLQTETFEVDGIVVSSVAIGTNFYPRATIDFQDELIIDEFPDNNVTAIKQTVVGSYDPNDKQVFPTEINYETVENGETSILDYVIRFQNTGNYPAEFVRIVDTIDTDMLDISSLQMIAASHEYTMNFNENQIEWFFDNIQLADSASNEPESHGYIHFRIRTEENLASTDTIGNQVAIYFDFNVPVITNTAQTIFYSCPDAVDIVEPAVICSETSTEFVSSVSDLDNYNWLFDGEAISSEESILLINPAPGIHTLQLSSAYYSCYYNDQLELNVENQPFVDFISSDSIFCESGEITASANSEMHWSFNGEILSNNPGIVVYESGYYSATVTNACGSYSDSLEVIVVDLPESIELLIGDVMLTPSVTGLSYAWYLNGELIPDENANTLLPSAPGNYTVEVFFGNGCSMMSSIAFIADEVTEASSATYTLSPNPAKELTRLQVKGDIHGLFMTIKDLTGRTIQTTQVNTTRSDIDCSDLTSGIYFIILSRNGMRDETMRLVVE